MLIGYNQATSIKHSSLEKDVMLSKKHGFDGLEVQKPLLDKYMETHTYEDLHTLFASNGVKALPVNAFCDFNLKREGSMQQLDYLCRCAAAAGAEALILVPALCDISPERTIEAIQGYVPAAARYGVKLALEFLGFAESSVRSLETAGAIAEKAGVGLVLDCAHIMGGTTNPASILALKPEQIITVHINDLNRKLSGIYSDSDRVWPGDGNMALAEILGNLRTIGYDGLFSVELFNEDYWEWPDDEIYKTAMQKTRAVL